LDRDQDGHEDLVQFGSTALVVTGAVWWYLVASHGGALLPAAQDVLTIVVRIDALSETDKAIALDFLGYVFLAKILLTLVGAWLWQGLSRLLRPSAVRGKRRAGQETQP